MCLGKRLRAACVGAVLCAALVGCGQPEATQTGSVIAEAPSIPEVPPPPALPDREETPIEGALWVVDGHPASIIDVEIVSGGRIAYLSRWAGIGLLSSSGEMEARPVLDASGWMASELDASPDGRLLAAATNHGAETWDVATGIRFGSMDTLTDVVAWSPDGSMIATSFRPQGGGRSGFIGLRLWDADEGNLIQSVASDSGYVNAVSWSSDGSRVAAMAGDFFVYDLESGEVVWRADASGGHLDWNPSAATIALIGGTTVTLFDVTARARATLPLPEPVTTGRWSDASHLTLVAASGNLLELEVASGETTRVGSVPKLTLAFESLGDGLGAVGTTTGQVGLWNLLEGREVALVTPLAGRAESIAVSNNGERLASGGDNGLLRVWRAADGVMLGERVLGERRVDAIAWSPDDQRIAVAHTYRIELYDASTLELLATAGDRVTQTLAFASAGTLLTDDGGILDGATLDEVGPEMYALTAAWGPDDATLALGSIEGDIDIVDAGTGSVLRTIPTELDAVLSLAWSGDGATLAAADYDTIVAIDAEAGSGRFSLPYFGPLTSLRFSPDSQHLLTTTWPNAFDDAMLETVRAWDPISGAVRFGLGGTSTAGGVAVHPNGDRLALVNWSGEVALLEIPLGD